MSRFFGNVLPTKAAAHAPAEAPAAENAGDRPTHRRAARPELGGGLLGAMAAQHQNERPDWRKPLAAVGTFAVLVVLGRTLLLAPSTTSEARTFTPTASVAHLPEGSTRIAGGAEIEVTSSSYVEVQKTSDHETTLRVLRGSAHARIDAPTKDAWHLIAGPYELRATKARFRIEWAPDPQEIHVAMEDGAVRVAGPGVGDDRTVRGTEELRASPKLPAGPAPAASTPPATVASAAPAAAPSPRPGAPATSAQGNARVARQEPARAEARSAEPAERARPQRAARAAAVRRAPPAAAPPWRALVSAGRYGEAVDLAEQGGFEGELARLSAADLYALADAARLAGRAARAQEAYSALRRRFPHDGRAVAAAFMLGRLAFEEHKDASEAAGWFATALQEQPDGALAQDALGRLMQARAKAGDGKGAVESARKYLERYPEGPRAAVARELTKGEP